MSKVTTRVFAALSLLVLLLAFVVVPNEANAASEFYGDYSDVSYIYDYGSCPSMQGLAVGSQKLYTIKIDGSDYYSFISMTDKDSGDTVKLYNSDAGSYYFTYLNHANDMDVWGIDDYSNLFVTTTLENSNAIVRLKRVGNTLTKVASYSLTYNGSPTCATALAIKGVSNGVITFITKLGMDLYTGSVSTSATSANIELTKLCSISKSKVYIKGEYLDLSSFVNQGMGYHNGVLYVPISGDDNWLNRSVVMVFNLDGAVGTIYPSEALVFRITSGAYSALMELESCDICSGDGRLYFSANRRVTNSDTNHDGVSYFDDYTFVKLTEPAKIMGYTVQYDANGGSGTMEDTFVPYGVTTPLRTNSYTKQGHKFVGWTAYRTTKGQWYYTNGSDSGWYTEGSQPSGYTKSVYRDGAGVAKTTSVDGDVVILYAQWEPITFTIRYNANGGSGTMADTSVTFGVNTQIRTNAFTRTGYTFSGWTAHRTTQDLWYYTNGTTSAWYAEGSQPDGYAKYVYNDGVTVAKTSGTDGDVVMFYAQWTPNFRTVTFVDDDGTLLQSSQVTYGTIPTPPAAPTKASDGTYNYTFAGWDKDLVPCTEDTVYTATYTAKAIPVITPKYPSLSFEGEIYYNVYFTTVGMEDVALTDIGLIAWNTPQATGTIDTATSIVPGAKANGNGYLVVRSEGIPAKKLGDTLYFKVYAKLTDGSYLYSSMYSYNAKDYAMDRLANSTNTNMKALCVAMLNYGAAAQTHFNYKPYNLMNAELTAEQQALVQPYNSSMINGVGSVSGAKAVNFPYSGFSNRYPSVSFEGAFSISYYFTPSYTPSGDMTLYYWDEATYNSAYSLTTANATGSVTMTATEVGSYKGTVEGIAAKEIDKTIYVAGVYTSGGVTYTTGVLPYSLGAYCIDRIANGSGTMPAFASATAVYGYYAKNYFA